MGKIVAIVGKPNAGKSTLFNRIVGGTPSIVDEHAGVTRDRHYKCAEWAGHHFLLVDTGGYTQEKSHTLTDQINQQIEVAIQEADLILFVLDCRIPITEEEKKLADKLRRSQKKIIIVANKADNQKQSHEAHQLHQLGLGEVHDISAKHGKNIGALLDAVVNHFKEEIETEETIHIPKIAILGRPNVGKSTLTNSLLSQERALVLPRPHTTRTPVHSHYNHNGRTIILVDTAGLGRKNKTKRHTVQFYAFIRSIKALEQAEVLLLLLDAREGITNQDKEIIRRIERKKKPALILLNKIDLLPKNTRLEHVIQAIRNQIPFNTYIPIIPISAKSKRNIFTTLDKALEIHDNAHKTLSTSQLNKTMQTICQQKEPPSIAGRNMKLKYSTQIPAHYPIYLIFTNHEPKSIPRNYKRYLENQLRNTLPLEGIPIKILFKKEGTK